MASISGKLANVELYNYTTEVPSGLKVGQYVPGDNGKGFRYVLAGASDLVVGNYVQSPATDTQFSGLTVQAAAAKGDTKIKLTNGSTSITANQFDGGTLQIATSSTASANIGEEYTIVGHTTGTTSATITFYLDRPLRTAVTTATTTVTISRSPWSGVIQGNGTAATGVPAGVAVYPVPATTYGWVQTHGIASVLSDGSTFAIGSQIAPSLLTAGAVGVYSAGTGKLGIGYSLVAASSTHTVPVMLQID